MKNILSITFVALAIFGLGSCTKNSPKTSGNNPYYVAPPSTGGGSGGGVTPPASLVGDVPSNFTKKTVIEESTAAWCGYCPNGATEMEACEAAHPDKVYGVAYHSGDVMSDLWDNNTKLAEEEYSTRAAFSGIPSGFVGRDKSTPSQSWQGMCNTKLAQPTDCGVAIATKKMTATKYSIEVHAGFKATMTGDYNVVIYLLENDVHRGTAYNQSNYMDADAGSPWMGKGNPMSSTNFKHNHVLEMAILGTGYWGTAIPAVNMKPKGEFIVTGEVVIPTYMDVAKTHVLAMIVKKGATAASDEISNAQQCNLGEIKKWD
jgi:hypothetical protein